MSPILRVNTATVAPQRRLGYWNDHVASLYAGMSVDSTASNFSARLLHVKVGRIGVMRALSDQAIVRRNTSSTPAPGDQDILKIHLQNRGTSINRQGRREAWLQVGDLTVCENRSSYIIEPSSESDIFALELPQNLAQQYFPDISARIMQRVTAFSLHGRLLFNLLNTICQECDPGYREDINLDNLEPVLLELLKPVLSNPGDDNIDMGSSKTRGLLQRLKTLVQQHLLNPDLGTEMLANEAGMSERRVQALFAELGTTPTFYIRDQRLDWAAERLRYDLDQPVTRIAHSAGFNDSAYFSRCFRLRYGETPKRYRARPAVFR
ncbi:helix-turn-helix domain-containing protein [Microbulbifer sp.]|uniref:helix-turn-helix domain-containing protein n=1 Tax=Microbulbifer sp. TaxID=1908541 RepID=UPI003F400C65